MNKTILKWAGSKVGIMEQLRPHLPKTKRLVEPFAGSCAVMMNTDYEEYLIADINSALINMYGYAACSPKTFLKYSEIAFAINNDEENYYRLRWLFNRIWAGVPALKTSVIFLYLNRHGFRGLCRYNKDGEFNVPFGHLKKIYFPKKEIIAFSDKAIRADIKCQGWAETLLQTCAGDGIYCDPPYMGTGFTQYHTEGFNDGDQVALAEALQALHATKGNPVTVSNSLAAKELYADLGFTIHEIEAPRKISVDGNRETAAEIIAVLGGCQ